MTRHNMYMYMHTNMYTHVIGMHMYVQTMYDSLYSCSSQLMILYILTPLCIIIWYDTARWCSSMLRRRTTTLRSWWWTTRVRTWTSKRDWREAPSIGLSVCLSIRLSDCLSVCLFVCLSVCLSVWLHEEWVVWRCWDLFSWGGGGLGAEHSTPDLNFHSLKYRIFVGSNLIFADAHTHTHYTLYNRAYFMDSSLSARTTKIGPPENFPLYGCMYVCMHVCTCMYACMYRERYWSTGTCVHIIMHNCLIFLCYVSMTALIVLLSWILSAGGIMLGRQVHSQEVAAFKPGSTMSLWATLYIQCCMYIVAYQCLHDVSENGAPQLKKVIYRIAGNIGGN